MSTTTADMPTTCASALAIRISPSWMPRRPRARLGSTRYFGGTRDTGTGHIHPLKLTIGTARVAAEAGAHLFENTRANGIVSAGGKVRGDHAFRHHHRRQGTDRRQRLWRRPRAGQRGACHADRLVHRRDRAARRRQPGPSRRRIGRRFTLRRSLFPQIEGRTAAVRRARDLCGQGCQGHPYPHPPPDRRNLPGAARCRDHPRLGRLRRHHACRASRSCARSCRA